MLAKARALLEFAAVTALRIAVAGAGAIGRRHIELVAGEHGVRACGDRRSCARRGDVRTHGRRAVVSSAGCAASRTNASGRGDRRDAERHCTSPTALALHRCRRRRAHRKAGRAHRGAGRASARSGVARERPRARRPSSPAQPDHASRAASRRGRVRWAASSQSRAARCSTSPTATSTMRPGARDRAAVRS